MPNYTIPKNTIQEFNDCPIPQNEDKRLKALVRYEALNKAPEREENFNRIVRLAVRITGLPIGFIHLLTHDKQYAKASEGFDYDFMPREDSFCQHTIMKDDIYEIEDPLRHPVFKDNPAVHGDMNIKYYIGVPLRTSDGFNIGTLCLIDHKTNKLDEETKDTLKILADEVISQFELKAAKLFAEEQNKEKDELIKVISHDLRNPLMGITGFTEYLYDEVKNEEHREILKIIRESGQSIARVVNILLNSPYLSRSSFRLNTEPCDAAQILRENVNLFKPYYSLKKQQVECNFPESLIWSLDPDKWRLTTSNLINNAIKFTPEKGQISIKLSADTAVGQLSLLVKDNGIGMDKKMINDLFSGNENIRREGTQGEASSGMGMTLIKKFCDLHGGEVHVESEQGKGSRFLVSIPG